MRFFLADIDASGVNLNGHLMTRRSVTRQLEARGHQVVTDLSQGTDIVVVYVERGRAARAAALFGITVWPYHFVVNHFGFEERSPLIPDRPVRRSRLNDLFFWRTQSVPGRSADEAERVMPEGRTLEVGLDPAGQENSMTATAMMSRRGLGHFIDRVDVDEVQALATLRRQQAASSASASLEEATTSFGSYIMDAVGREADVSPNVADQGEHGFRFGVRNEAEFPFPPRPDGLNIGSIRSVTVLPSENMIVRGVDGASTGPIVATSSEQTPKTSRADILAPVRRALDL